VSAIQRDNSPGGERGKAIQAATRFLQRRARSEHEIRVKLEEQGFTGEVISYVISRLVDTRLVNDARFAAEWVESRSRKAMGPARIRRELRAMGIDEETAGGAMALLAEDAGGEVPDGALEYARRGLRHMSGQPEGDIRRKLTASLVRRGYGFAEARRAVSAVMASAAMDTIE
jgi:regulatory protein